MTAESQTLSIGQTIAGRFKIVGRLGKGAMGVVFKGQHLQSGQEVAIKVLALTSDDMAGVLDRFEQEAKVLATLRSSNTVRMIDFGRTEDGSLFMALELLVGQPVDELIREHTRRGTAMTEAETCALAMQVLRSLAEAHGKGLVHRDLKPSNLFAVDEGVGESVIKVLDFGIARVSDSSLTGAGQMLGTPTYMSPEQWKAEGADHRADLYSLGCVLYCCVTGQPPYASTGPVWSLMSAHMNDPIPDPRALAKHPLSDGFVALLRVAMAKSPADRFTDAKAMREAVQAIMGGAWAGTPVGARLPTLLGPPAMQVPPPEAEDRTIAATPRHLAAMAESDATIARPAPSEDRTIVAQSRHFPQASQAAAPALQMAPLVEVETVDEEPLPKPATSGGKKALLAIVGLCAIGAAAWFATRPASPPPSQAAPATAPAATVTPPMPPSPSTGSPETPAPAPPAAVAPAPAPAQHAVPPPTASAVKAHAKDAKPAATAAPAPPAVDKKAKKTNPTPTKKKADDKLEMLN